MTLPEAARLSVPIRAADAAVLRGDPGSVITLLADPDTTAGAFTSNWTG